MTDIPFSANAMPFKLVLELHYTPVGGPADKLAGPKAGVARNLPLIRQWAGRSRIRGMEKKAKADDKGEDNEKHNTDANDEDMTVMWIL